jgi:hypothetical protein
MHSIERGNGITYWESTLALSALIGVGAMEHIC